MRNNKIVILGSTGMLGYACTKHFTKQGNKYKLHVSTRDRALTYADDTFFFDASDDSSWQNIPRCDYVINCIGIIPQRTGVSEQCMFDINHKFVHRLADHCRENSMNLIHISTDSVFSGNSGLYDETSVPDPVNAYGRSKLLGERDDYMCLRTSIIGDEIHNKFCLLEWLRRQSRERQSVNGYINQLWNGITADEYARMCDRIISKGLYSTGIKHVYTNVMSKYELIVLLNSKFDLDLTITPMFLDRKIDRTLVSCHRTRQLFETPSIEEMVAML